MAKPGAKRKPSPRKIAERKKPALRAVPAAVPSDDVDHRELDRLKAELAAARNQIAELEARADIDPLLDILNRRGFERELARSLAYVKRHGTPAALRLISPVRDYGVVELGLPGDHQVRNSALAVRLAEIAAPDLTVAAVGAGLRDVVALSGLRGRGEPLYPGSPVVLDVAHNVDGWRAAFAGTRVPVFGFTIS